MTELSVKVRQRGRSASEGLARNHCISIDRPEDKGGCDEGPMGGEMFLLGLGGCYMSNLLAAIRDRKSTVRDVVVDVIGKVGGTPPRFLEFTLVVSGGCEDRDELVELTRLVENSCIVPNSLRPHLPVHVRVK